MTRLSYLVLAVCILVGISFLFPRTGMAAACTVLPGPSAFQISESDKESARAADETVTCSIPLAASPPMGTAVSFDLLEPPGHTRVSDQLDVAANGTVTLTSDLSNTTGELGAPRRPGIPSANENFFSGVKGGTGDMAIATFTNRSLPPGNTTSITAISDVPIPAGEPTSMLLAGFGFAGLRLFGRRCFERRVGKERPR